MRKVLLAVALAGVTIAGAVGVASPAGALGIVDLAATSASDPGTVAPPGALVRYAVSFSNTPDSLLSGTGTGTNQTVGGGTFVGLDGDASGCGVDGTVDPVVTCDLSLAPGETKAFGVIVKTPATAGELTNTSTVSADPDLLGVIPDVNAANNAQTSVTTVTAPAVGTAAFLRPGDTLTWRNHVMSIKSLAAQSVGVVASMEDAVVAPGTACGEQQCSTEGLRYGFEGGNAGEPYEGRVTIMVDFEADDPCYGYGAPKCFALYYRLPDPLTNEIAPNAPAAGVRRCDVEGLGIKEPCLRRVQKIGAGFVYEVEANTNDPEIIPPISGLKL